MEESIISASNTIADRLSKNLLACPEGLLFIKVSSYFESRD
jgi:hypothetical protein